MPLFRAYPPHSAGMMYAARPRFGWVFAFGTAFALLTGLLLARRVALEGMRHENEKMMFMLDRIAYLQAQQNEHQRLLASMGVPADSPVHKSMAANALSAANASNAAVDAAVAATTDVGEMAPIVERPLQK